MECTQISFSCSVLKHREKDHSTDTVEIHQFKVKPNSLLISNALMLLEE